MLVLLSGLALACGGPDEDAAEDARWEDAGQNDAPVIGAPIAGSAFNAVFPPDGHSGTRRTFTQEKPGYAEAQYSDDGAEVVTISVSDTRDNPGARDKFASATDRISGHPVVDRGANSSMVLVDSRFQVRASQKGSSPSGRHAWLSAVDLRALSSLN